MTSLHAEQRCLPLSGPYPGGLEKADAWWRSCAPPPTRPRDHHPGRHGYQTALKSAPEERHMAGPDAGTRLACSAFVFTCIRGAVGHGRVQRLGGVWPFQSRFVIIEGRGSRRPWGAEEEMEREEMHQEVEIGPAAKESKFMSRLGTKLYLLPVEFDLCSADNREKGGAGYSLYAVFGGGAALVELVRIVEFIFTGRIGKVWHGVWRDGDESWGGDATAWAWWDAPWQQHR